MTDTLWRDEVPLADAQAMAIELTDAVLDRLLAVPPESNMLMFSLTRLCEG